MSEEDKEIAVKKESLNRDIELRALASPGVVLKESPSIFTDQEIKEIREFMYEILTAHRKMYDRTLSIINKVLIELADRLQARGIFLDGNKLNLEDRYILTLTDFLVKRHILSPFSDRYVILHYRHKLRNGNRKHIEFDYLLLGKTISGWRKRIIGVEFKETDLATAVDQAIERRKYTHYQYVFCNIHPETIFEFYPYRDAFFRAMEEGVGILVVSDKGIIVPLLKPKLNSPSSNIYEKVMRRIEELKNKLDKMKKDPNQALILDWLEVEK